MLGDKNQSALPVAFSLMASFISAISMFGLSAEVFYRGTQFSGVVISYILATPIIGYLYLPVFFKLGNLSLYEVIRKLWCILCLVVGANTGVHVKHNISYVPTAPTLFYPEGRVGRGQGHRSSTCIVFLFKWSKLTIDIDLIGFTLTVYARLFLNHSRTDLELPGSEGGWRKSGNLDAFVARR